MKILVIRMIFVLMGIKNKKSVICIEDSLIGLESVISANLPYIAVPNEFTESSVRNSEKISSKWIASLNEACFWLASQTFPWDTLYPALRSTGGIETGATVIESALPETNIYFVNEL